MAAARMMKVALHQVIHVVSVGHRIVPASGSVNVPCLMRSANVIRRALRRVGRAHFNDVLIKMIAMQHVQMAIVQVVNVIAVMNRGMAASGPVNVGMSFVNLVAHHPPSLSVPAARVRCAHSRGAGLQESR
jgi:hypothetical protein